ncbi:MAG TPA: hypothetical protein PL182_04135, partial [Pseudobdellovibrionaceae bacterium]|nr:hypothetical protein [Pseudobdellovibrionaceae bacterium]
KTVESLGFASYRDFMVEALMQELESRQKQLQMPPLPVLSLLRTTLESGSNLQKRSEEISQAYRESALVPLNLEVQAARIGREAAPIATISSQYDLLARNIQTEIESFAHAGRVVQNKIQECQFNICNSILQKEIYRFFELETKATPVDKQKEMTTLARQEQEQLESAKTSLQEIRKEFLHFQRVYDDVEKLAVGLEIVSLSGKIEVAKLRNESKELFGLLNDLAKFKNSLKRSLQEINTIGSLLIEQTEMMKRALAAG